MTAPTDSTIRFSSFPRTKAPPPFVPSVVGAFRVKEAEIATERLADALNSNDVLKKLAPLLQELGFEVEFGKSLGQKVERPVFFGENGVPTLRYEIDAYHADWRCGLEIEAARAVKGNAIFRDLFQALVMAEVEHLCLAVPNAYKYVAKGRPQTSFDYHRTLVVAEALFGHSRMQLPYGLTVIGY